MNTDLIDKYHMLPRGCRVLCAVSGGADSVFLLSCMRSLASERGFSVAAAHYDHALRGAESERDAEFVRDLCLKYNVPFLCERGDVKEYAAARSMGTEEAARTLRYEFLYQAATALSCDRIATAHTADDNAETVLMNLARGAGLRGLGGIPPVRGMLIRPMLTTARAEVEEYLEREHIPHVEDASNKSDDYARNRVRHQAVPALRSVNAAFSQNASRAALLAREDEEYLASLAEEFIKAKAAGEGVDARALAESPFPIASRVVRLMAAKPLPEGQVRSVLTLCTGSGLAFADTDAGRFAYEQGVLRYGGVSRRISPRELPLGGRIYIPEAGVYVSSKLLTDDTEIYSSLNTFFFNYENICGTIICTSRGDGDKIRLARRGCTKNLSDLFTEKRLTQSERDAALVLRDDAGVIAVQGFGLAERCAAERGRPTLRIDIEAGEKL